MAASTDTVTVDLTVGWILGWWLGRLNRIDYDVIGQLAGIAGETAKQHNPRGEYDLRNLENVLQGSNSRRAAKGLSLLGAPSENVSVALGCSEFKSNVSFPHASPLTSQRGRYDPLLGGYRSDTAFGWSIPQRGILWGTLGTYRTAVGAGKNILTRARTHAMEPSRRCPQAWDRAASKRFTDLARFVYHGRHFRATVAIARRPTQPNFGYHGIRFPRDGGCRPHDNRRDQILLPIGHRSARWWMLTPLLDGRKGVSW